jgi:CRP/FNR family transcriptional regulator
MGHSNALQKRAWDTPTFTSPCADCEIRSIGICAALKPDELERMHRIVKDVRFAEGQMIFSEGDPAESLFNVLSGAVRLVKLLPDGRRQITGFLLPGAFLGIALNSTYAYSAEAIVDTKLCRFGRREAEGLLKDMPSLEHRLLGEAANELVAAQDQMLLLGRKTAKERLASFLVGLSRNAKRHGFVDNPVPLPMSRTDIADFLGLTTETVSRTFTRLRQANVVALEGNAMVRLLNRQALDDLIAGGDEQA